MHQDCSYLAQPFFSVVCKELNIPVHTYSTYRQSKSCTHVDGMDSGNDDNDNGSIDDNNSVNEINHVITHESKCKYFTAMARIRTRTPRM